MRGSFGGVIAGMLVAVAAAGTAHAAADRHAPTTHAAGKRVQVVAPGRVTIRWSGSDRGSGVRSYRVQLASRPSGSHRRLRYRRLAVTRRRTRTVTVRAGRTYYVRVLARDRAGNVERSRRADIVLRVRKPARLD